MTGGGIQVVVCAGGLGTRIAGWARYVPKEFYPVDGRPGIVHLLEEIAQPGPAEVVIVCHPYYEAFTRWAGEALGQQGHDSYSRAAGLPATAVPAELTVTFITQRGPYADLTSVLNGASHFAAAGDLYVAFADNLYRGGNPLAALRAAPPDHPAVLARAYRRELAACRGVIVAVQQDGYLLMDDLVENPDHPQPVPWSSGTAPAACFFWKAGHVSPPASSASPAPTRRPQAQNPSWRWPSPPTPAPTPSSRSPPARS